MSYKALSTYTTFTLTSATRAKIMNKNCSLQSYTRAVERRVYPKTAGKRVLTVAAQSLAEALPHRVHN